MRWSILEVLPADTTPRQDRVIIILKIILKILAHLSHPRITRLHQPCLWTFLWIWPWTWTCTLGEYRFICIYFNEPVENDQTFIFHANAYPPFVSLTIRVFTTDKNIALRFQNRKFSISTFPNHRNQSNRFLLTRCRSNH